MQQKYIELQEKHEKLKKKFKELLIEIESLKKHSDFILEQALKSNLEMVKAVLASGKAAVSASTNLLKAEAIIKELQKEIREYKKS